MTNDCFNDYIICFDQNGNATADAMFFMPALFVTFS
jgi:hypothetical protein